MAFPLHNRLKKQKDFEEVFAKGKTVKGSFFFLKTLERAGSPFRCAVVVPSKVSRQATIRNRLRRRILATLQLLIPADAQGFDLAIIVQRGFQGDEEMLKGDIEKVLRQAHSR